MDQQSLNYNNGTTSDQLHFSHQSQNRSQLQHQRRQSQHLRHQQQQQQQQSSLPFLDTGSNVFAADSGGASAVDMTSTDDFRRDSLASSAFSPLSTEHKSDVTLVNNAPSTSAIDINRRTSFAATNPFRDDYNNTYREALSASAPTFAPVNIQHRHGSWQFDNTPGTASPLSFEPYSASGDDFDVTDYPQHAVADFSAVDATQHSIASGSYQDLQQDADTLDTATSVTPLSPNGNQDWMGMAAQDAQSRAIPRHMRTGYRPTRPTPTRASSDGIRKKNARIEIPPDRNLSNIEELIENAQDEEVLKELKAQRRLLRNREAALASRQRKKQHTEDLEVKEQRYIKQINSLKNECADLSLTTSRLDNELRMMHQKYAEVCHLMNAHDLEKEDLVMRHTQESGRLRRQVQYLTEQLELGNDHDQSAVGHTNFSDFTSDMNALSVDNQNWNTAPQDNMAYMQTHPTNTRQQQKQSVVPQHVEPVKPTKREQDQPIASGVLFMILLCGAFVASRTNSRPALPQLPEEVRVASDKVLNNLLKDPRADVFSDNNLAGHSATAGPAIHGFGQMQNSWPQPMQQDERHSMYRSLVMPTPQQEADQLFNLSPAEYQSLTSAGPFDNHPPQSTSTPRRNLAETLASVRQESISSAPAAEVYTRSLLWDQIPADVVKQFKELVKATDGQQKDRGKQAHRQSLKNEFDTTQAWGFPMGTS